MHVIRPSGTQWVYNWEDQTITGYQYRLKPSFKYTWSMMKDLFMIPFLTKENTSFFPPLLVIAFWDTIACYLLPSHRWEYWILLRIWCSRSALGFFAVLNAILLINQHVSWMNAAWMPYAICLLNIISCIPTKVKSGAFKQKLEMVFFFYRNLFVTETETRKMQRTWKKRTQLLWITDDHLWINVLCLNCWVELQSSGFHIQLITAFIFLALTLSPMLLLGFLRWMQERPMDENPTLQNRSISGSAFQPQIEFTAWLFK